ncbi:MAG: SulP family inorganic anion transporter [Aquabacterium sp.]|uniref:SulP family inorganic anion transporter n=1 Tax=Aquabacterium sp. TaxID=1872578 RepID=UPI00122C1194|nr:SulP family inorganic anion transporter [Aquabacterium sp.]TAK95337.1 MAG: SulP family inorganic anion transporter [Aquabacterium sp.]
MHLTSRGPSWRDVLAGLSVAGLLLPEAVAYAGIGNMPPQAGVLALFMGLLSYALLGSSRFAIVSATSSSAAVLLAATGSLASMNTLVRMELAAGLVLLTGLLFVLGAVAKVGAVSAFISKPVLRGFAFGLALIIIVKQLPRLLGVVVPGHDAQSVLSGVLMNNAHWHGPSMIMGGAALLALYAFSRLGRHWPGALMVMLAGIALQHHLHLADQGVVPVGVIELHLNQPAWPSLQREQWLRLGELAVAMVLILYAESYGAIRSLAIKHGDEVQPNRDLLALGVANVLSSIVHGMPVGAGYSASVTNESAGAQSRWAGLIALLVLLVVAFSLLPVVAQMPEPVLAAIVIHAVAHMLDPRSFKPYFVWQRDRLVAMLAVAAVLWLGVLDGLLAAIGISLFMTLRGLAQAHVAVLGRLDEGHDFIDVKLSPLVRQEEGLLIVRPEAPMFFGNVESLMAQIRTAWRRCPGAQCLILSLEESSDLDGSCVEAMKELSAELSSAGQLLIVARLKSRAYIVLRRAALSHSTLTMLSIDDAVKLGRAQLPSSRPPLQPSPLPP